jgi:hypothetical protein
VSCLKQFPENFIMSAQPNFSHPSAETPLQGAASPEGVRGTALAPVAHDSSPAIDEAISPEEVRADDAVVDRVGRLKHDVGWTLITAGIVGLIVPGVLGTPFLLMGALALWPGNRERVERWRKGHSPRFFHGSMKQINRFLDDLERRYPRIEKR